MTETVDRYPCCEHCIDIKEGCPRSDGHSSPCPFEGCESALPDHFGDDPISAEEIALSAKKLVDTETDIAEMLFTQHIEKMRDDLIDHVASIIGFEPPGIRVLLRALSHPGIANDARLYFEAIDTNARCTKYEPPWNCALEAEAQYQNIKYGWLGAASAIGYDDSWCENCRSKVMGR